MAQTREAWTLCPAEMPGACVDDGENVCAGPIVKTAKARTKIRDPYVRGCRMSTPPEMSCFEFYPLSRILRVSLISAECQMLFLYEKPSARTKSVPKLPRESLFTVPSLRLTVLQPVGA
jgi:hypothetical protein